MDVWIIESNTVYKEVPFMVVVDWIQQGRLLADDKLKPSGTAEWFRLGGLPEFAAYLPRPVPHRAEDQAEALEGVHGDFSWKRPKSDEDEDVDMIPLIDVSLVLLVFFMMISTGAAAGVFGNISTPAAIFGMKTDKEYEIGIKAVDAANQDRFPNKEIGEDAFYYFTHKGERLLEENDQTVFLQKLAGELGRAPGQIEITLNADGRLKSKYVRKVMIFLEGHRDKVRQKYTGVSDKGVGS
jgi:biopolymer transport protein ExbD